MKDENGNYSGMLWDMLQLFNERFGFKMTVETCEIEECVQKVLKREVDGALAIDKNVAEKLGLKTTRPYYQSYTAIFTRETDKSQIKNIFSFQGLS
jgi:hypothetical protein